MGQRRTAADREDPWAAGHHCRPAQRTLSALQRRWSGAWQGLRVLPGRLSPSSSWCGPLCAWMTGIILRGLRCVLWGPSSCLLLH